MSKNDTEKISPQAVEFEKAVLGAIMQDKNALEEVVKILIPDVFYREENQKIFEAIVALYKKKEPVDILTVSLQLKKSGDLNKVVNASYITDLTSRIASSANTIMHARVIMEMYMKRCYIAFGQELTNKSYSEFEDVFQISEFVNTSIKAIDNLVPTQKRKTNDEALAELKVDIEAAEHKGGIIGYSSGNKALDFALTGLRTGNKYVVAALPGEGKTSLTKSIAIHLSTVENLPGLFISMEMTHKQLMMVVLSELHQISNEDIQRGKLTPEQKQKLDNTKESHPNFWNNFNIDDEGGLDPMDIRRKVSRLVKEKGIKWLIVDYLQLAKLKGKENKGKTREQIISDITAEIKNICKEYDLIGIELSQLTKEAGKRDNKRPQLSDLKDSGAIEANADAVIFIYRPEKHGINTEQLSEGFAELIIAKNRYGRIMNVAAKYIPHFTQFKENEKGVELATQPENSVTDF